MRRKDSSHGSLSHYNAVTVLLCPNNIGIQETEDWLAQELGYDGLAGIRQHCTKEHGEFLARLAAGPNSLILFKVWKARMSE